MKARHKPGVTLIEILMAITITGIIAALLIPKLLSTNSKVENVVVKTESAMKTLSAAIHLYEASTGKDADPTDKSYDQIFYDYGNYFVYKQISFLEVSAGPPADDRYVKYYLLSNGARLAISSKNAAGVETGYELLTVGIDGAPLDSPPEYDLSPTDATANPVIDIKQWHAVAAYGGFPATAADGFHFCGNFPQEQCFYLDVNGVNAPNSPGPDGDLIPFRIDPTTNSIRTLYQWERDLGMNEANGVCQFLSSYDVQAGANLGTCPSDQTAWNTAYLCPGGGSCQ